MEINKNDNPLRNMSMNELRALSGEVREEIIKTVKSNGGHLSSNLGMVELTVALHYVLNLPEDKLLFDVGHQCYTHKLLTDRGESFNALRKRNGISGFCDIAESEYDSYGSGHSGSSIAAALGMCMARDRYKGNEKIACVIGDGSIASGEALEAINNLSNYKGQLLIVLNDNGMSISRNQGGLYNYLSKKTVSPAYRNRKSRWKKNLNKNGFGRGILKCLSGCKRFVKRLTGGGNNLFEQMGVKYVGVTDGHNIKDLIEILGNAINHNVPVILHVKTIKGKGYMPSEKSPDIYHGVGAEFKQSINTFSESISPLLKKLKKENEYIHVITAAMADGTGTKEFGKEYPDSFTDMGICEQSSVSLACGMALRGLRPIVFLYSTFLQRAYDQIEQEVCLDGLPVIFMTDRAGYVGADGKTHQGLYDIPLMRSLPNMNIFAPSTVNELESALRYALEGEKPTVIRYPNGDLSRLPSQTILKSFAPHNITDWQCIQRGGDAAILAVGPRMVDMALSAAAESGASVAVYNCTSINPLDTNILEFIREIPIITMEEGMKNGGFGSAVVEYYALSAKNTSPNGSNTKKFKDAHIPVVCILAEEKNVGQGNVMEQIEDAGLNSRSVVEILRRTII